MAYGESLADRIRAAVDAAAGPAGIREIKMFGGLCWTVNTHMAVGTGDDDLMVHVGKDGVDEALQHGARPATMGGANHGRRGTGPGGGPSGRWHPRCLGWAGGRTGAGEATEDIEELGSQ
jgi:hypothetical protein